MRRRVLGISAAGLMIVLGVTAWLNQQPEAQYSPVSDSSVELEALGAYEYFNAMKANQVTGKVDFADVQMAKQQVENLASLNKRQHLI
jgi:hypothetical protein